MVCLLYAFYLFGFFYFFSVLLFYFFFFFFSSRRRHTRYIGDWSSDVCSSDLHELDLEVFPVMPGRFQPALDPLDLPAYQVRLGRAHDDRAVGPTAGQVAHPLLAHGEIDRDAGLDVRAKEDDRILELGHGLRLQPDSIAR